MYFEIRNNFYSSLRAILFALFNNQFFKHFYVFFIQSIFNHAQASAEKTFDLLTFSSGSLGGRMMHVSFDCHRCLKMAPYFVAVSICSPTVHTPTLSGCLHHSDVHRILLRIRPITIEYIHQSEPLLNGHLVCWKVYLLLFVHACSNFYFYNFSAKRI